jgi:hypothetical protein
MHLNQHALQKLPRPNSAQQLQVKTGKSLTASVATDNTSIQLATAVPHLSQTNWQNPQKLQKILEKTRLDRKKLYQVLR